MSPNRSADHFTIDEGGWCRAIHCEPSENFDQRPDNAPTSLLVIHNISLPAGQFGGSEIGDLFCNRLNYLAHPSFEALRGVRVSAHFLIRRDGDIIQFVSTHARAWHAGLSVFDGKERCNDFSIGIELEGSDHVAFTDEQYHALTDLTLALQHACPLTDVVGHQHIAPGRKTDPGPCFDWRRYHDSVIAQVLTHPPLRFTALL